VLEAVKTLTATQTLAGYTPWILVTVFLCVFVVCVAWASK